MEATKINHEQNHIGAIVDYLSDRPQDTNIEIRRYYAIELALPLFSILLWLWEHASYFSVALF